MIIVRAKMSDIDTILSITQQQRLYLKNAGIPQWQNEYPSFSTFENDVKSDRLFIMKENDEIVGFFALVYPDHCYDYIENGRWSNNEPYIAIHRMAVAEKYKKSGFASKALDFVKQNHNHIRIDTHELNLAMNNCVKKNDFKYAGVVYMEDKTPRNAYEWNR